MITWRTIFVGSGGLAQAHAWGPDGKTVIVEGYGNTFVYRLHPEHDHLSANIIWRPPMPPDMFLAIDADVYSPDGRYLLHHGVVLDTRTGWIVFKFRDSMLGYRGYRWVGDMLTAFDLGDENRHGMAVTVRTSDFLPQ